jgi:hypothetical protein
MAEMKEKCGIGMFGFLGVLAAVAAAVATSPTQGWASDFQSPRASALGGAGHAGPMLNDAIYLNPSFVSFLPSYSLSGNYSFFKGPDNGAGSSSDPHGHILNASLQDGRSELFQAGVGLTLMDDRRMIHIGASRTIVTRFGVGAGAKLVLPNVKSPSPIWDSTLSVTGVPWDWLQLAAVLDNVAEPDDGLRFGMVREYILGSKFNIKGIVLAYFDPHWAPHASAVAGSHDEFGHELGLEFPFFQELFFRLGNFRNANVPWLNLRGRGYTTGLGWIGPRMSLDGSIHRLLEPLVVTTYNFGFTVYF